MIIFASAISDTATLVAALATFVVAVTGLRNQARIRADVESVHTEVKTANGITMAALADRAEGRRVEDNVDIEDRTASEQHYVDRLNDPAVDETPNP